MFRDTIKQTLLRILTKELLINKDQIHAYMFFDADLGMDAEEFNRLLYFAEGVFGISIPEDQVPLHSRFTDLVMSINKQWMMDSPSMSSVRLSA